MGCLAAISKMCRIGLVCQDVKNFCFKANENSGYGSTSLKHGFKPFFIKTVSLSKQIAIILLFLFGHFDPLLNGSYLTWKCSKTIYLNKTNESKHRGKHC